MDSGPGVPRESMLRSEGSCQRPDAMIEAAVPRYGISEYVAITYHTLPQAGPPTFLSLRESAERTPQGARSRSAPSPAPARS